MMGLVPNLAVPKPSALYRAGRSVSSRKRSVPVVYLLTVGSVILSTVVAIWLRPMSYEAPYLFYLPPALFSLWYGGFRPAVLATFTSALMWHFFVLLPYSSAWSPVSELLQLNAFTVTLLIAAWVIDRRRSHDSAMIKMLQELVEAAAEPMLVRDHDDRIVFWNRGAERLYGWSRDEALGKRSEQFLRTFYSQPLAEINREVQEKGHWSGELTKTTRDGRTLIVESSWNRYVDASLGEFVLQTSLDVSDRNRHVNELNTLNRALRAMSGTNRALVHAENEEELLQRVVEVITTEGGYRVSWVALPQDDGSVVFPTASGDSMKYLEDLQLDWKSGSSPTAVALRTGEAFYLPDVFSHLAMFPFRDRLADAGVRSELSLPLKSHGKVIGALSVCHNLADAFMGSEVTLLTEIAEDLAFGMTKFRAEAVAEVAAQSRLQLEDQLRQAQKMEAVGQLAGGIAHDFNNLLMIILGQNELLLESGLSPVAEKRARAVMQSGERAAALTRQLLAFSRKQVLQPSTMNLNQVVQGIFTMLERVLGEDIELSSFLADQLWFVKLDKSQLEQVLMNLVVNARDAMPEGGKLTIETSNVELGADYVLHHAVVPPGKYVMLAVTDNGTGMPPEVRAKIFEPFFTTKVEGKGTGLGLSTVYGIVKQSGGFIWVYSEVGKGTSFKLYFPMDSFEEEQRRVKEAPLKLVSRNATILVVEDDDNVRSLITDFLSGSSYKLLFADSVEQAMQVGLENHDAIDLLLTDVVLKGGNGKTLAKKLQEAGCNFRVLFTSGYTPNTIAHHGVIEEGSHFLQKPFARSSLLTKIEEALSCGI